MIRIRNAAIALAVLLLAAGGTAQEKKPAPMAKNPVVEQETAPSAGSSDVSQVKTGQPEGTPRSTPAIRRDPFRPFTLNLRTNVRRRDNLSPLERYEIGQLKLVGIIWSIQNPTALVEDTSGLGYTVRVGTPIGVNEGKVKKIAPDRVLIEEEYIDLYGAKKMREVSMRLAAEKLE